MDNKSEKHIHKLPGNGEQMRSYASQAAVTCFLAADNGERVIPLGGATSSSQGTQSLSATSLGCHSPPDIYPGTQGTLATFKAESELIKNNRGFFVVTTVIVSPLLMRIRIFSKCQFCFRKSRTGCD